MDSNVQYGLVLDTMEAINAVRDALESGLAKGMWDEAGYRLGMANMLEAERVLRMKWRRGE